jgi:hypothetical protein
VIGVAIGQSLTNDKLLYDRMYSTVDVNGNMLFSSNMKSILIVTKDKTEIGINPTPPEIDERKILRS